MKKSQLGFSMIEVLISILVMSFGLLGIGGLMMSGVNNSTGSDLASRATQSANEMMDAMRANSSANTATSSTYLWPNWGTSTSTLTGTTAADTDRRQWLATLRTLPGGDGIIEREGTAADNRYRISVRYSNCMGTLNATEKVNCAASNANSKNTLIFKFKI
jgi:type IV pilus assembly protein PilV